MYSIQEYLKKINSRLSYLDCVSIGITMIILATFVIYIKNTEKNMKKPLLYIENKDIANQERASKTGIFGSVYGKTYTFSWCQGASRILEKNKIYFTSQEEAARSGRSLSKLCSKK